MNKGRPTRIQQVDIQRKLRTCFEWGISAPSAAKETGVDKKTAYKYFDEWIEQIIELETGDFFERQKKEHQRIIFSYDNDIILSYKYLEIIDVEIQKFQKENKPVPKHLFSIKLNLMRFISNLKERKGAIMMQPVMETSIEKKIEEMITKHVKDRESD